MGTAPSPSRGAMLAPMAEPLATAVLLTAAGLLVAAAVLVSRTSGRLGVPTALLFLAIGMLAGSQGVGRITFEDYGLTFRLGTVALVLILFDGGLSTPWASVRRVLIPAALLATVGVAATAALAALGAWWLGLPVPLALLFGAVVSSTDAASVFSVLRGGGIELRHRVGTVLELESGLNDPMAVILTLGFTRFALSGEAMGWHLALETMLQLGVGLGSGLLLGLGGRWIMARARLSAAGLYPVLTLALALLAFGLPTLLWGSGFLAVYATALVLGNGPLPYLSGLRRVHDALAWLGQVAMFLLLGLLAIPSRLVAQAGSGLALGLLLVFVARPAVVALCLAPFRFPPRELLFIGWVGLRGAVPIILATFPVLAGVRGAGGVFDLVFFVVVVSTALQGTTAPWLARRLGLERGGPAAPRAVLEIVSTRQLAGEVLTFQVEPASAVSGSRIADLPFPEEAAVMLILRGRELVAPRGNTVLTPGDQVSIFARPEDVPLVRLLFGSEEER
jgi:cell volume regulation protein A